MYEYLSGEITDISPSFTIIEINNIGYFINISLTTFEAINNQKKVKLYIHQVLREDTNTLFGFANQNERQLFRQLISVSGIGPNTARLMLSSLNTEQIIKAIEMSDVNTIKSVKGIGAKTAQRLIVDLKDKVAKITIPDNNTSSLSTININAQEALSALTMLGFAKKTSENKITEILKSNKTASVEEIVKQAIKKMSN